MKLSGSQFSSLNQAFKGVEGGLASARCMKSLNQDDADIGAMRSGLRRIQEETSYALTLLDRLEEDAHQSDRNAT